MHKRQSKKEREEPSEPQRRTWLGCQEAQVGRRELLFVVLTVRFCAPIRELALNSTTKGSNRAVDGLVIRELDRSFGWMTGLELIVVGSWGN